MYVKQTFDWYWKHFFFTFPHDFVYILCPLTYFEIAKYLVNYPLCYFCFFSDVMRMLLHHSFDDLLTHIFIATYASSILAR